MKVSSSAFHPVVGLRPKLFPGAAGPGDREREEGKRGKREEGLRIVIASCYVTLLKLVFAR